jgi:hypothetical protein
MLVAARSVPLPELASFLPCLFPSPQILEMDDDEEEREFSKSIVYDFFSQAEQTFQKMDDNL